MLAGVRCPWPKCGHCAAAVAQQWLWPNSGCGPTVAVAQQWLWPNSGCSPTVAMVRWRGGLAAVAWWRGGAVAVAASCQEQHSNSSGATFGAISGMLQIGGVSGNCSVGAKDTAVVDWVVHVAHGQPKGCAGVREREAY